MNADTTNALLVQAGKAFKLTYRDGEDARIPTSAAASQSARQFGRLVRRTRWQGCTWFVVDASLRERAIAAYEAAR